MNEELYGLASFFRRESNEISRFWLYPRMQIEKSEGSKRDIVASRENVSLSEKNIFPRENTIFIFISLKNYLK